MSKQRGIYKVLEGIEQSEGDGARVRRLIGTDTLPHFSPFLIFDHFKSKESAGFPEHPHAGQETITYCLQGSIAHEDLLGHKGMLYPGDLQFMTAGKGIVHSEMPVAASDGSPAILLQLWVDLPAPMKECKPRYKDLREWEIPTVSEQEGKLVIKVIAGTTRGVELKKDVATTQVEYLHFITQKGALLQQELQPDYNYFLYVLKGKGLAVNGKKIRQNETVLFSMDGDHITCEHVGSPKDTTEFILVGGPKLNQDIVQHGPFVAASKKAIEKKVNDFHSGRGGFDKLKTWKTLISSGVTQEMIDGPLRGNLDKRHQQRQKYLAKQTN